MEVILIATGLFVLMVNAAGLIVVMFIVRVKHRFLFSKICDLRNKIYDVQHDQLYKLRDEVRKNSRLFEIKKYENLGDTGLPVQFTAQSGEDILIYDFFKQNGPGYFVEAGACDGELFSNTYLLESLGWEGLLVEPHPKMAEQCKQNRPNSAVVHAGLSSDSAKEPLSFTCVEYPGGAAPLSFFEADSTHLQFCEKEGCSLRKLKVPCKSLNSLLEGKTDVVDFLSLDVEGMELEVLRGFDILRFNPRLLLIEKQRGECIETMSKYLAERGYEAVADKGCNVFYVRVDMREKFISLLCEGESIS